LGAGAFPWRAAILAAVAALAAHAELPRVPAKVAAINAPYITTPPEVVDRMLTLAAVSRSDTVYDLGCGDGRIVIAAARKYGARGVGIDIDPERIREARENARRAGVSKLVEFRQQDLFDAEIRDATVVTIYLLPSLHAALRPKFMDELRPGARIVAHSFPMGTWRAEREVEFQGYRLYLWTVPEDGLRP
jgi:cyclopropane fatty-acyl-phospholipid synthase-like methyltransferase